MIDCDTPILSGLDKMKQHRWYVNEVTNELCNFDVPGLKVKLTYKKEHLYLEWTNAIIFFSRPELLKIHRHFAHPTPNKLANLLKKLLPNSTTVTLDRYWMT